MKTVFAGCILIGLVTGGAFYYMKHVASEAAPDYRMAAVTRGNLISTIAATGTLEPEEVIDVGAQIAGRIESLGLDEARSTPKDRKTVDYGTTVQEGTILARIDDTAYTAKLDQTRASLLRAEADLNQMKAKLYQAEQDLHRAEQLRPKNAIAASDYDLAVANEKSATANVKVGEAIIQEDRAVLKLAETDLGYTVIKSPVHGVIIDRRVNVGQTVVAGLNAPSLFLIAKDLKRMQVWASVNEADIGQIQPGMPVSFTVDAFPKDTFHGKVNQVRLNATMNQNVVTYTVVVETDNSNLKLLPYLTASLQFEVQQHKDILKVSNAALRWKPTRLELVTPAMRDSVASLIAEKRSKDSSESAASSSGSSSGSHKSSKSAEDSKSAALNDDRGRVWMKDGEFLRPVQVQVGATDGISSEISGDGIKEGVEVVVGENVSDTNSSDTTNPFAFKNPWAKPSKKGI